MLVVMEVSAESALEKEAAIIPIRKQMVMNSPK
jgi:hypothetical protein